MKSKFKLTVTSLESSHSSRSQTAYRYNTVKCSGMAPALIYVDHEAMPFLRLKTAKKRKSTMLL